MNRSGWTFATVCSVPLVLVMISCDMLIRAPFRPSVGERYTITRTDSDSLVLRSYPYFESGSSDRAIKVPLPTVAEVMEVHSSGELRLFASGKIGWVRPGQIRHAEKRSEPPVFR